MIHGIGKLESFEMKDGHMVGILFGIITLKLKWHMM